MKKNFKEIKNFLNSFVFPALSIILVFFQSFIIWQQTKISKEQLELSAKQLELERKNEEALFYLYTQQEISGNYGTHYDLENMYIESNGKFTQITSCEFFTYIDIDYYDVEKNDFQKFSYQLSDYYFGTRRRASDKYLPLIIQGTPGNNEKLVSFKYSFPDKKNTSFNIRRYVKLKYVNLFNEDKTVYFFVTPLEGSRIIEYSDETKELFERRMDSITIESLTPSLFIK